MQPDDQTQEQMEAPLHAKATPLLPCPFCGPGQSAVTAETDDYGRHFIACGRCGSASGHHRSSSPEDALGSWNTRPIESRLHAALQYMLYGCHDGCDDKCPPCSAARAVLSGMPAESVNELVRDLRSQLDAEHESKLAWRLKVDGLTDERDAARLIAVRLHAACYAGSGKPDFAIIERINEDVGAQVCAWQVTQFPETLSPEIQEEL